MPERVIRPRLWAIDAALLIHLAAVSGIVLVLRPPGTWVYLVYHALAAALVGLLILAYRAHGGPFWSMVRHWYPVFLLPAGFREVHYLVSADRVTAFDPLLAQWDLRLFGDVMALMDRWAHPLVADVMTLGYWVYFALPFLVGIPLYRWKRAAFRESVGVLTIAYCASFLCYMAIPAIGPHWFRPRPAAFEGILLAGPGFRAIKAAEWEMPDAFPSAHVLIALVVLVQAWRYHRPLFWVVLVPALLCIASTVYLQYHYVVDVAAAVALLAPVVLAGRALSRALEGPAPISADP